MKTVEIKEATASLASYARGVRNEPVVLTRDGKPIAALVSVADADWETISLSTNPAFVSIIERSRTRYKKEGGISTAEMRRRWGVK